MLSKDHFLFHVSGATGGCFYTTVLTNIVSTDCISCGVFSYLCTLNFHFGRILSFYDAGEG